MTTLDNSRDKLEERYKNLIEVNRDLSRQIVSFQANKNTPFYRWFKYKEGFSEPMVSYFLKKLALEPGKMLDPFAGAGSALFAARALGWATTGVELLPVGIYAMKARLAEERIQPSDFKKAIDKIRDGEWRNIEEMSPAFEHINITAGAFPKETEEALHRYLWYCENSIKNDDVRMLLKFAAYSILEKISYTRKDGQYLRWLVTRNQRQGHEKPLPSEPVAPFESALYHQLELMWEDFSITPTDLFSESAERLDSNGKKEVTLFEDSCLKRLRRFRANQFDFVLTSPPYCNRYDYTRTYALELVFLGVDDERVKDLRQEMLSCTVENRAKIDYLRDYYRKHRADSLLERAMQAFDNQDALQEVLSVLERMKSNGELNNDGVVRMVHNYFLEMSLVIHECARIMKPGAHFVMVNDNVSYNGEVVPVDLILSEFAVAAGLQVERIWTLGRGKGNSSQQMGRHGRREVRKCVYVWRKIKGKRASLSGN